MVLKIVNEWADGTRNEESVNTSPSRGRYLLSAMSAYPHTNQKVIANGFQYETPSANTFGARSCITKVTLERGFV